MVAVPGIKERVLKKCVDIYGRRKSLHYVDDFFHRAYKLDDWYYLNEAVWAEIRKKYFPELTVDQFLEKSLQLFRDGSSLEGIFHIARNEIPFVSEEYSEWVERFDELVMKEPNAPTQEDWESLEEWLLK